MVDHQGATERLQVVERGICISAAERTKEAKSNKGLNCSRKSIRRWSPRDGGRLVERVPIRTLVHSTGMGTVGWRGNRFKEGCEVMVAAI